MYRSWRRFFFDRRRLFYNTRRFPIIGTFALVLFTTAITILLLVSWNEERSSSRLNDTDSSTLLLGGKGRRAINNQKNAYIVSVKEQYRVGKKSNDLLVMMEKENKSIAKTTFKAPIECTKIIREIIVSVDEQQNRTTSVLNLPSIFNYLPHLAEHSNQLLRPRRMKNVSIPSHRSYSRNKKTLAIGIPTVNRPKQLYLLETLKSLLNSIAKSDLSRVLIIIYIGEKEQSHVDFLMDLIRQNFLSEVRQGIIDVIAPPEFYYPDLDDLPLTFGDSAQRVKWRSKQNLDYSYLMMYAQGKGEYYLQLEDDIIATNGFVKKIEGFVNRQAQKQWFMLEFCRLGFIGKLFHAADLSRLVEFFLMFYKVKPNDWLLDHYMDVLVCSPEKSTKLCNAEKKKIRITSRPSLFQHVGKHSSLKGKIQKLIDRGFPGARKTRVIKGENEFFPHKTNVEAKVHTNADEFSKFKIQSAYEGHNLAWIKTPVNDTFISFQFNTPVTLKRFLFRTGNKDHPGDILKYGVVEALTARTMKRLAETSKEVHRIDDSSSIPKKDFAVLGTFNDKGLAKGNISSSLDELVELRVRVTLAVEKNWVIFNEFLIE